MSLQIDFGIAIQQLRKQRGLSQERLALEADIDRRYMSDVENGKRNISLDIIERIASQLDIIQDDIIELRANIYSSFDSSGNACQGYLYELETGIAKLIKELIQKVTHTDGLLNVLKRF